MISGGDIMLLKNKKILITGMLSNRSIAYGVAQVCHELGAELIFTYQSDRFKDRGLKLAHEIGVVNPILIECDVASDESINNLFQEVSKHWDYLDGLLHSIAYVPRAGLEGDFVDNVDRETFTIANDISSYSLLALARGARALLKKSAQPSIVGLTYLGSDVVIPNYNMSGVSKAALNAIAKYAAASLGKDNIRVNLISAGPVKTLAATGIDGFGKILAHVEKTAPLKRNITLTEIGNAAAFLLSSMSSGITGDIIFVDAGYHVVNPINIDTHN